ncbi:hypothetical protein R3P38DRAFT_2575239 [Favolaschia claudopus]|uniref:DUF6535 domain-containing protein n=1 Tax=Favolaschia claudopus TaxID=2862362 RepID=A0AAV9ZLG1_9AGAR
MCKAIADLKPKPVPTTDKKTAFWKGYNELASEYDKEFLKRYDTDLDTSLIFAGLFSAVASAFIIQIQPDFDLDPSLLSLIAQSLLYVSLGSTLLVALLAVLGKQWLMYYRAAGERGTIEARGLERQRKLDGLIKWKFELIMQAFPLLLQFGLFLFAAALSVYLWRIHQVLAGIVLGITTAGTMAYLALLASATIFKDSPFQTPLAPFIRTMSSYLVPESVKTKGQALYERCAQQFLQLRTHIKGCTILKSRVILPRFAFQQALQQAFQQTVTLFNKPIPAPEVPAVHWVLETSTDPILLAEAADMSIALQWPLDMDLPLDLLRTQFVGCFEYVVLGYQYVLQRLRDGMGHRATQFGWAYLVMQNQHPRSLDVSPTIRLFMFVDWNAIMSSELATVLSIMDSSGPHLMYTISQPWLLRVLHFKWNSGIFDHNKIMYLKYLVATLDSNSNLTCSSFSDYLFLVYFCLVDLKISIHDMRVMDKSAYEVLLYKKILETLPLKLKSKQIDMQLTADLLRFTLQLAKNSYHREWNGKEEERQTLAYEFCKALPQTDGWIQVLSTPGLLSDSFWKRPRSNPDSVTWIHNALESIPSPDNEQVECKDNNTATLYNLLCALYNNGIPPSKHSLALLIQLLSLPGRFSFTAAQLLLQENVHDWYTDPELGPKLQDHSVWALLSAARFKHVELSEEYVDLAYLLSAIPGWQPHIRQEKCCWLDGFWSMPFTDQCLEKYNAVFKTIWTPSLSTSRQNHAEEAIGLVCGGLSEFWSSFDSVVSLDPKSLFAWLECSDFAIFDKDVQETVHETQMMQESFIPLQRILFGFVGQIQSLPSETMTPILTACGEIVRDLATKMLQTEIGDLFEVRGQIYGKIEEARKLVAET